ncbi:hypothetical protein ACFXDE_38160 [Kitasatospora sp. NPDC059408]|uniref:hypothetical protein n=1 Tax=Kitasatospora sp. NPDC059408 TaxID=3346823 RepID=UPI0036CEEC94
MAASRPEALPSQVRAAALDLRALRALPFATVCVVLAAAGHVFASGSPVPPGALFLGWVLSGAAAAFGARRERSARAIIGGLAGAQGGLHVLFHAAQASRTVPARGEADTMADMPGMPGMSGMGGRSGVAMAHAVTGGGGAVPHTAVAATHVAFWCHATLLGLSPAMLAAHLAATVVAGWWLRRGEAAVWSLVRLAAGTASAAVRACADQLRGVLALFEALSDGLGGRSRAGAVRRVPAYDWWGPVRSAPLRHVVIRRGPPLGAAV